MTPAFHPAVHPTHVPAASMPAPFPAVPAGADPTPVRPVVIDVERPEDAEARELLLDRAFGPGRFAKTCARLRAGRLPASGLSLVARSQGGGEVVGFGEPVRGVVGTVRLWHVAAGDTPALMLGPLAVDADWRCHRIGGRLMNEAVARARALGHRAILLVGDAPYYERFGFARRPALGLRLPGPVDPERFLGLELVPGALADARGMVRATAAIDLAGRRRPRPERPRRRRAA